MHLPDWIKETNLRDLRAKVENLPLEKIALGRRTYRATVAASTVTTLSGLLVLSAFTHWLSQKVGWVGSSVLGLFLLTGYILKVAGDVQSAWERSKFDSPAWSWNWCEVMSKLWLPLGLLSTAFQMAVYTVILLPLLLLSGMSVLQSLQGAALVGSFGALIYLPIFMGNVTSELIRGLLGLLGGTGKRVERPNANPTFIERLLSPRMASIVPDCRE